MNSSQQPLAERLRPKNLSDVKGQDHLLGKQGVISKMLTRKALPSLVFWGPPGVGKTTIAHLIAEAINRPFSKLSAINSGVKDVRHVIDKAKEQQLFGKGQPVLFIDEIHRFSKSQQDSLLEAVEKGTITLIGATTENPSFEVIPALLSRCQVHVLKALKAEDLIELANKAVSTDPILKQRQTELKETDALLFYSNGDARKMLNMLEWATMQADAPVAVTNELVESALQENTVQYDKTGEQHYDVISAFIKSIRGSDPNAALYWLAVMLEGGEDPKFIARRLLISASEDIGNANPTGLVIANNCFDAVTKIGMPEASLILSQTVVYLSNSPKSNASYLAIKAAQKFVREHPQQPVPLHLRNAPTALMKDLDYGADYKYSHDFPDNFVQQEYLPEKYSGQVFYKPGKNAKEQHFEQLLKQRWKGHYNY